MNDQENSYDPSKHKEIQNPVQSQVCKPWDLGFITVIYQHSWFESFDIFYNIEVVVSISNVCWDEVMLLVFIWSLGYLSIIKVFIKSKSSQSERLDIVHCWSVRWLINPFVVSEWSLCVMSIDSYCVMFDSCAITSVSNSGSVLMVIVLNLEEYLRWVLSYFIDHFLGSCHWYLMR